MNLEIKYPRVCPKCKKVYLSDENANTCECGYKTIQFGRYSDRKIKLATENELDKMINDFIHPELPDKDMIVVTQKYIEKSAPVMEHYKYEVLKKKDHSYWRSEIVYVPFMLLFAVLGILSGGGIPVAIIGFGIPLYILYKHGDSVDLIDEYNRRDGIKRIVEKNQKILKDLRSFYSHIDMNHEPLDIEKKYIQISQWNFINAKWRDNQEMYLEVLKNTMSRMNGDPDNIIPEVDFDGIIKSGNHSEVLKLNTRRDKDFPQRIKMKYRNKYTVTDIYEFIMNNDMMFYKDIESD